MLMQILHKIFTKVNNIYYNDTNHKSIRTEHLFAEKENQVATFSLLYEKYMFVMTQKDSFINKKTVIQTPYII